MKMDFFRFRSQRKWFSYVIVLSGRHKKQRTANEYNVHEVCFAMSIHRMCSVAVSDIHKVRKRRLIVITSTPLDSEVRMKKKLNFRS